MTNEERDLITGLFNRLRSADQPQKDKEAENLIQQSVSAQPTAPYLLVQTVLVQEHALNNAQTRIQQLEKQLQDVQRGDEPPKQEGGVGGFLSGLFGGHGSSSGNISNAPRPGQPPQQYQQGYAPSNQQPQPPYPTTANMQPSAGGSFLKSALGTAAGVAGGAMLFQGIQNLMGHNAGPFGGGGFGGLGGGSFFGGGGHGGPDIIENREVVNNFYEGSSDRNNGGNRDNDSGGSGSFLGEDTVGFRSHGDNQGSDAGGGSNFLGEDTIGFRPHQEVPQDPANSIDAGNFETTPLDTDNAFAGDNDNSAFDNNYDSDNADAFGGGDSGGNDDSSYV